MPEVLAEDMTAWLSLCFQLSHSSSSYLSFAFSLLPFLTLSTSNVVITLGCMQLLKPRPLSGCIFIHYYLPQQGTHIQSARNFMDNYTPGDLFSVKTWCGSAGFSSSATSPPTIKTFEGKLLSWCVVIVHLRLCLFAK